jgi:hypothetical protein
MNLDPKFKNVLHHITEGCIRIRGDRIQRMSFPRMVVAHRSFGLWVRCHLQWYICSDRRYPIPVKSFIKSTQIHWGPSYSLYKCSTIGFTMVGSKTCLKKDARNGFRNEMQFNQKSIFGCDVWEHKLLMFIFHIPRLITSSGVKIHNFIHFLG